jgi:cobalt-zinc-cadmium resistance protein CzcA
MLNRIIHFSVHNKLIIGFLTLALVVWGIFSVQKLPIDAVPDITNNQVQVITVSPSLAAPEIERLITFPIEQATANIPGILEIRSFSRFGLSLVTIVFNDATDVYWARQQVAERLQQVRSEIPPDAGNPFMGPVTTGLGEIFQYVVKPKKGYEGKYSAMELRTIQDWIVRRQLLGTPGVADVSSFGGQLKQYEVAINSERLKSMGVTIADVFDALRKNNQNTGGAYIEKGPTVLYIRSEGLAGSLEDIRKVFVKHTSSGIPVYIKDIAEVRIGAAVRYGALCFNDEGEVAGAIVMMLKGGNSSQVIKSVKERMVQIEKTLPEGVMIEPFLDRTKMVNNAIGTVEKNLLEGALIVIFILVLFLGNLRAGLIVASVIPLSMLVAIILMNLFGVSGNLMSLGALDFGLIVDGAVIIVEAVMHRLYHSRHYMLSNSITQSQMDQEVEQSAGKMMNSAVFGQIIILIVYLPILSLVGIEGKMFKPMAQTVSFALVGAFILSLTYVPMISSLVLSKKMNHRENFSDRMMNAFQRVYEPALKKTMDYPRWVLSIVVLLFVVAVIRISTMGGEFIPKLEEGDFAVETRLMTGSSLTQTIASTQQAAGILKARFPEVIEVVTKIGSGEIPTDPMPIEASDMMIILKDKKEWTSAKTFDELADKMSLELQDVPGISVGFQFPVQMRFNELLTGARQDVVCKIFGEDLDTLAHYAKELGALASSVKGASDLYVESVTGLPQIVVNYNRDAMSNFHLNIEDVNRVVRTAFAGEAAGMVYENERRFDLVVRLNQSSRKELDDVRQLLIATPSGAQIPLYQVADVSIKEGPNQIQREDAKRRIVVGFNVRGRDVQTVVKELNDKVAAKLQLPSAYYITYGGAFENLVEARKRLSIALPVALFLIFAMLYFAFGKLKYGVLVFSAIPLSAIGGVFALWLVGMPFSISAGIGFIALFGVAVLNGIVLIAEFNRLKNEGMHDLQMIIQEGTKVRLRPVLMTASVASLGFLPMALSQGAGAEVQRPLATVVIGGLITATFLTLVVLPVLYKWMETEKPRRKKSRPVAIFWLLLGSSMALQAQSPAGKIKTLEEVLALAKQKNLTLLAAKKESAYWKQLQQVSLDPPKTTIGFEYGKVNSLFNDNRFTISQPLSLPQVYQRQRAVNRAQYNAVVNKMQWQEKEILREVKWEYWQLADALERWNLVGQLDSAYAQFAKAAALRYSTGETNQLEMAAANTRLQQVRLQRSALLQDIQLSQEKLKWLLQTEETLLPATFMYTLPLFENRVDTILLQTHPYLLYKESQVKIAKAHTALERNNLSPDFALGYNNMTIVGYQSKDGVNQQYYGSDRRFGMASLTMGIPLFTKASRQRIKASSRLEEQSSLELLAAKAQYFSELTQLYLEQQKWLEQYQYYEKEGLVQANLLMQQAAKGYSVGEIGYLDWLQLMDQSLRIQLESFTAKQQLRYLQVQIDYLLSK